MRFVTYRTTGGTTITYSAAQIGIAWHPENSGSVYRAAHGSVVLSGVWSGGEIDRAEYDRLKKLLREVEE